MGSSATAVQASPYERFRLREILAAWNRALDWADIDALRQLTTNDAEFVYEDTAYDGPDALVRFVRARASTADIVQRTHVNHLKARRYDGGFFAHAMTMIVHMRPATTPYRDGAPTVAWVGYTEDVIRQTKFGLRIAARRFVRWDGFLEGARQCIKDGRA